LFEEVLSHTPKVSDLTAELKKVNEALKSLEVAHPNMKSQSQQSQNGGDVSMNTSDSQSHPPPTHTPNDDNNDAPPPATARSGGKARASKRRKFHDAE
jgi:hypothetical protein